MTSRIGRVALKLRVPELEPAEVAAIRRTIERSVLQEAFDELERAIHERVGDDAIVCVKRLAVRWQLDDGMLADPGHARALGRELAGALLAEVDAIPGPQRLRPDPAANLVVFAHADHHVAAVLADRAEERSAWFHEPHRDAPAAWAQVVAAGPARVASVERWLERMERRDAVARWLASAALAVPAAPSAPTAVRGGPAVPTHSRDARRAIAAAHEPPRTGTAPACALDEPRPVDPPVGAAAEPIASAAHESVVTDHAGVWYLARLVRELELGEALWAVGVNEGDFLAHVVAAVLGPDALADPAWRWFGGAFEREPVLDALADWAADEVRARLGERVAGCACLVAGAHPRTADVVERAAAALVARFCARLGIATDLVRVRAELAVPGRMVLEDQRVVVAMPMERTAIDLRRAGLDFDPGYLPWLARKVELVFED